MSRRWWAGPGLGWAGPIGSAWPTNFLYDGPRPGPARQFSEDGPRPGPAHQFSEDGPRPGPAHNLFKISRPGPARPIIFPKVSARSGPAHHMATRPMKHGLYMGRPDNYVGRPMCCPVVKGAGAYADVIL